MLGDLLGALTKCFSWGYSLKLYLTLYASEEIMEVYPTLSFFQHVHTHTHTLANSYVPVHKHVHFETRGWYWCCSYSSIALHLLGEGRSLRLELSYSTSWLSSLILSLRTAGGLPYSPGPLHASEDLTSSSHSWQGLCFLSHLHSLLSLAVISFSTAYCWNTILMIRMLPVDVINIIAGQN